MHTPNEIAARALSIAVLQIVGQLFPVGFDLSDESVIHSLDDINEHYARTGRFRVWKGASDQTIFGDAEVNYALRAWHDWCHWRYQCALDLEGERQAAAYQVEHLTALYGASFETVEMASILLADVVGQAEFFAVGGNFLDNQAAFVTEVARSFRPVALKLVRFFGRLTEEVPPYVSPTSAADWRVAA